MFVCVSILKEVGRRLAALVCVCVCVCVCASVDIEPGEGPYRVLDAGVGAFGQQQLDHVDKALLRRMVQRRPVVKLREKVCVCVVSLCVCDAVRSASQHHTAQDVHVSVCVCMCVCMCVCVCVCVCAGLTHLVCAVDVGALCEKLFDAREIVGRRLAAHVGR